MLTIVSMTFSVVTNQCNDKVYVTASRTSFFRSRTYRLRNIPHVHNSGLSLFQGSPIIAEMTSESYRPFLRICWTSRANMPNNRSLQAYTKCSAGVGIMLDRRRRLWPSKKPTLNQCFFAGSRPARTHGFVLRGGGGSILRVHLIENTPLCLLFTIKNRGKLANFLLFYKHR